VLTLVLFGVTLGVLATSVIFACSTLLLAWYYYSDCSVGLQDPNSLLAQYANELRFASKRTQFGARGMVLLPLLYQDLLTTSATSFIATTLVVGAHALLTSNFTTRLVSSFESSLSAAVNTFSSVFTTSLSGIEIVPTPTSSIPTATAHPPTPPSTPAPAVALVEDTNTVPEYRPASSFAPSGALKLLTFTSLTTISQLVGIGGLRHQLLFARHTRFMSTNSNSWKDFLRDAFESDKGQETTNVHILARRQLQSDKPVTVEIINTVRKFTSTSDAITKDHLRMFEKIVPVHLGRCPLSLFP
jgi:hypothetical protein